MVERFHPKRGSIYWVDLDPVRGSEQGKKRPCLVLQNDVGNATSTTTIVACITSQLPSRHYPFHVWLPDNLLEKQSVVLCEQLRTVATERFDAEVLATCPETVMNQVERAIRVSLGLARTS